MASLSARLVEYLASLSEADLAPELMQSSTIALLDTVGCGLYGSQKKWGEIAKAFVLSEHSSGKATLYGCTSPIAPARAALANGTATHGFELDDIIQSTQGHPGAVVVPSALAVAEQLGASGPRLLLAMVVGYEMFARVGRAFTVDYSHRGFHVTGVNGSIAATVAAAVIMRLEVPQLLSAIGIACSSASGIKAFIQGTGGMVKRWHAGRAAEAGVVACELAQRGFTGPKEGIDGKFGLLQVIGGQAARPEFLDANLGSTFAIANEMWVKVYPCCGMLHSTLHALENLKQQHRFSPAQVSEIRVHTCRRAVDQNGDPNPQETMAAQYSIPYSAGVAVAKDPRDLMAFDETNLQDPVVRGLMSRTKLFVDEKIDRVYPLHLGARVEVSLTDGREIQDTVLDPYGSAADPCTPAVVEAKFRQLAGYVKDPATIESIIAAVRNMPSSSSVESLSKALREENL